MCAAWWFGSETLVAACTKVIWEGSDGVQEHGKNAGF